MKNLIKPASLRLLHFLLFLMDWNNIHIEATKIFLKLLRQVLNDLGLSSVKIVAGDGLPGGAWNIVEDMLKDSEVMDAVDIIGLGFLFLQIAM